MKSLHKLIYNEFISRFKTEPVMINSPGRVNLIGEHTDYNGGFVLPAAINKAIVIAIAKNNLNQIRLYSLDMKQYHTAATETNFIRSEMRWPNYIIGVADQLKSEGIETGGFDCVFGSDLPIGAGLSSSAALEGAVVFGLNHLFGLGISKLDMAKIGQRAENEFVGVKCGIMDQFANLHGKIGNVIRLDCRSLEYEYYPFNQEHISIVLIDTMVRRELAASEYNIRRKQCEDGVGILHKKFPAVHSLRDATLPMLEELRGEMDPVVFRRCRYVLEENNRVFASCEELLRGNMRAFGERMYESHIGLRDEYEVSCPELDFLVDSTLRTDAVLGSRMMGGGFGGCTINIVGNDERDTVVNELMDSYMKKTGVKPNVYVAQISDGTHLAVPNDEVILD